MKDLESEGIVAAAADYDHELCKVNPNSNEFFFGDSKLIIICMMHYFAQVKAMLGAEKQQLLSELVCVYALMYILFRQQSKRA
jgi:hypothetical protein